MTRALSFILKTSIIAGIALGAFVLLSGSAQAAPSVNLDADRTTISANGTVILRWSNVDVDNCRASASDGSWQGTFNGNQARSGTQVINNIKENTTFTLTCTPTSEGGNTDDDDMETDATASSAPRNLTAQAGDGQIRLNWDRPSDMGTEGDGSRASITSYKITDNVGGNTTVTATSYTFTGLSNGTQYEYRVRATNSAGLESSYSDTVRATPKSSGPTLTLEAGFNEGGGPSKSAPAGADTTTGARYNIWFKKADSNNSYPPIKVDIEGLNVAHSCYNFPGCGPDSYYHTNITSKPIIIMPASSAAPGTYPFTFRIWVEDTKGNILAEKRLSAELVVIGSSAPTTYELGDVNRNGSVTAFDASLVLQHVEKRTTLDAEQLGLADVTDNGSVTALDADIILNYTAGNVSSLPFNPPVGDVSLNGEVSAFDAARVLQHLDGSQDISGGILAEIADVTDNGSVTALDADVIQEYVVGNISSLPFRPKLGDVSLDGTISSFDAARILQHVEGSTPLSRGRQELADVNGDGQITALDARIIQAYVVGTVSSLPARSLKYGDVSMDGRVSAFDAARVQQHVEGVQSLNSTAQLVADVDDSGSITSQDADYILEYTVGTRSSFPVK